MRKQVNFDIVVDTLVTVGGGDGHTKQEVLERIERQCPKADGWEVIQVEVAQTAANNISILFFLGQYADVPEVKASAK
jgi:hypothetical protein